jgi:hypothetical protein
MLAPTRELVAELNRRARAHGLDNAPTEREVLLADGNQPSVGDVIITRTNDRQDLSKRCGPGSSAWRVARERVSTPVSRSPTVSPSWEIGGSRDRSHVDAGSVLGGAAQPCAAGARSPAGVDDVGRLIDRVID